MCHEWSCQETVLQFCSETSSRFTRWFIHETHCCCWRDTIRSLWYMVIVDRSAMSSNVAHEDTVVQLSMWSSRRYFSVAETSLACYFYSQTQDLLLSWKAPMPRMMCRSRPKGLFNLSIWSLRDWSWDSSTTWWKILRVANEVDIYIDEF